jgi:hypothetical protein
MFSPKQLAIEIGAALQEQSGFCASTTEHFGN